MTSFNITHASMLIFGCVCVILFVYFIRKDPRRILCGILLVLALYFIITGALELFLHNTKLPEGGEIVGAGEETLILLQYIFMLISFLGGIGLIINGIVLLRREGVSLSHILPCAFGIMAVLWPILDIAAMFMLLNLSNPYAFVLVYFTLSRIILYVPGMLAAALLQSLVYAALPKPKTYDFILVLGAGLKNGETVTPLLAKRLDRGIRLYETSGKKALLVVSGGKGSDEKVSEAFAMQQYLLGQGIPKDQIVLEDQSTNTDQNIRFSKAVMETLKEDYTCMIATSNYHVLRAVILAKTYGMKAQGVGSKTALYYLPIAFIREYIAIIFGYKKLAFIYIVAILLFVASHFFI